MYSDIYKLGDPRGFPPDDQPTPEGTAVIDGNGNVRHICLSGYLVVGDNWLESKPTTEYYSKVAYAWGASEYIYPV